MEDLTKKYMERKDILSDRLDAPKCKSCGHVLMEHYHLKSSNYGCIGKSGKCDCMTFVVE